MKYAQIKSGNKLHLVYEMPNGTLSDPVCGIKADHYRISVNLPMGMSCKNCLRRLNSKAYNEKEFLIKQINRSLTYK